MYEKYVVAFATPSPPKRKRVLSEGFVGTKFVCKRKQFVGTKYVSERECIQREII